MRPTLLLLPILLAACGDNSPITADASHHPGDGGDGDGTTTTDGNPLTPDTLAGTGLCADAGCTTANPGILEYAPQYTLWSDTATKRRWIQLPAADAKIDTSDMDYWKFPIGTKIWKEFTRDGVRCETRYMVKLADETDPGGQPWFYVSYQWSLDQMSTTAVTAGADNVNGTQHDIPSRNDCKQCHERLQGPNHDRGRVLGFNALSLDYTPAAAASSLLSDLITSNTLTAPPTHAGGPTTPYFPLTGFTAHEKAAFGYFHANCGHCHNPSSPVHDSIPMELRMLTTDLTGTTAPAFTTTVGVTAAQGIPQLVGVHCTGSSGNACVVKAHDTASSTLFQRMNTPPDDANAGITHMPAKGSEDIDPAGITAVTAWIGDL